MSKKMKEPVRRKEDSSGPFFQIITNVSLDKEMSLDASVVW